MDNQGRNQNSGEVQEETETWTLVPGDQKPPAPVTTGHIKVKPTNVKRKHLLTTQCKNKWTKYTDKWYVNAKNAKKRSHYEHNKHSSPQHRLNIQYAEIWTDNQIK